MWVTASQPNPRLFYGLPMPRTAERDGAVARAPGMPRSLVGPECGLLRPAESLRGGLRQDLKEASRCRVRS